MRDQQLTAEVIDGRLVVSIGVDALRAAIERGDGWEQHEVTITDVDAFARAIARALVEDGGAELQFALDLAADWVAEEGLDEDGLTR